MKKMMGLCFLLFCGGASAGDAPVFSTQKDIYDYWRAYYGELPTEVIPSSNMPRLLAKATPDECFNGIGKDYPEGPPCEEGVEKVNQSYIWSMTRADETLWFGTGANLYCQTLAAALSYLTALIKIVNDEQVCEFGKSGYASSVGHRPLGDWRRPQIYSYDTQSGQLLDRTPSDVAVDRVEGFRFAMAGNGVVIVGGPARVRRNEAITLFAFDDRNGQYLGSWTSTDYRNLRRSVSHNGNLYIAMATSDKQGEIVRWTGDRSRPFSFETVGDVPAGAYEIALHENRLFVTTSPNPQTGISSGLFMSPPIPDGGLTAAGRTSWEMVWQALDYEADRSVAMAYGGGALASFDGRLYWGTLHVPLTGWLLYMGDNGIAPLRDVTTAILGAARAMSLFSGEGFGTSSQNITLEYGYTEMPAYVDGVGWTTAPNRMGAVPRQGLAGFGDPFIGYVWDMQVHNGSLYIGTFDQRVTATSPLHALNPRGDLARFYDALDSVPGLRGADLYRIEGAGQPARAVDRTGLGNYLNYGVRNIVSDGKSLYLGMANPANLATDVTDDTPEGGWELIRLDGL